MSEETAQLGRARPRTRTGGFAVVLGNPPWERVKLQEQEFFAQRAPAIAGAPNADARKRAIAGLEQTNPVLLAEFHDASRRAEGESHLMRSSSRFPLCGRGDINTYAVFAETCRDAIATTGRVGIVVPMGIAIDDTYRGFFEALVTSRALASLFAFYQIRLVFPGTDTKDSFCLLTFSGLAAPCDQASVAFDLRSVSGIADPGRGFTLSPEDIALLNPNTLTCPVFSFERDAEITKAIYRRVPVLIRTACDSRREANSWNLMFMAMFHMANDSDLFVAPDEAAPEIASSVRTDPQSSPPYLPLYEAKLLHQFDHRWATYAREDSGWLDTPIRTKLNKRGKQEPEARSITENEHGDPSAFVAPRYWVREAAVEERLVRLDKNGDVLWRWDRDWLIAWRDISYVGNERTLICSIVPRTAVGHTAPLLFPSTSAKQAAALVATLNSHVLDYCVRQKVRGSHITYGYMMQFAVPPPGSFCDSCIWDKSLSLLEWIAPRVLELVYQAQDLDGFARDLGYEGPPFGWDDARRARIRSELDAAFFHVYGVPRDDADYIMDTFTVFKTRDEQHNDGEYKTKETILAIYDEMAEAIATGESWMSPLSPPPGDPRATHTAESR